MGGDAQTSHPRVWIYASFAARGSGGSPAGVVASNEPLSTARAQEVAAVLSVPTTGFVVVDQGVREGCVSARFFTPQREIDACGHVMVALASALVELGVWTSGREVVVRARGGEFQLRLKRKCVEITYGLRLLEPARVHWPTVTRELGIAEGMHALPLAISDAGLRHLIVPVSNADLLGVLSVGQEQAAALSARAGVDTICVWAFVDAQRIRLRDYCAGIGTLEEAASATTAAALAFYLAQHAGTTGELVVEQGVEMGRPCRLDVTLREPDIAIVRGSARRVAYGALDLAPEERGASDMRDV